MNKSPTGLWSLVKNVADSLEAKLHLDRPAIGDPFERNYACPKPLQELVCQRNPFRQEFFHPTHITKIADFSSRAQK